MHKYNYRALLWSRQVFIFVPFKHSLHDLRVPDIKYTAEIEFNIKH